MSKTLHIADDTGVHCTQNVYGRARFLSHALQSCKAELGFAGNRFVEWLTNVINAFDPHPPPSNLNVHLLLDLYERESDELGSQLALVMPSPSLSRLVDKITDSEVNKAIEILLSVGELPRFAPNEDKTPASRFRAKRAWVSQCVQSIPLDVYTQSLGSEKTPPQLIQEMIEGAHDDVRALYAELQYPK